MAGVFGGLGLKLESFSVDNFRSITSARKILLDGYTLLVGPNNEGKSNILHALVAAMRAIEAYSKGSTSQSYAMINRQSDFDWKRDFPISRQESKRGSKTSKVSLRFQLTDDEIAEFVTEIECRLDGFLPIDIEFGEASFSVTIAKPGRGHATLNKNKRRVCKFISRRMQLLYVPAVRTASSAQNIIKDSVDSALKVVENDSDYQQAMRRIEELQRPVLDAIAGEVLSNVQQFVGGVKSIELRIGEDRYRSLRRDIDIFIDDGALTHLRRKGDGVQSLVAVGLMRYSARQLLVGDTLLVAIEEPEAHLHPTAVHELRNVITSISESSQVIVSSHSPLFVDRTKLSRNIIVQRAKASPATSFAELRKALGVRFSDNLENAQLILLVEGASDVASIRALIESRSGLLSSALGAGNLQIEGLGSASNLVQKASYYLTSACAVHAFLDDDLSGRLSGKKAIDGGLLKISDLNYAKFPGRVESELENFVKPAVYADAFIREFEVDVYSNLKGVGKQKWSQEMKLRFERAGKQWDDSSKTIAKQLVVAGCLRLKGDAFHHLEHDAISNLVTTLERKLVM